MIKMIKLNVEPRITKTWQQFCKENPAYSIALDGYVSAGPKFNPTGPYLNLNHHEDVDRLATRSTSGQVFMYIKQGLFTDIFKNYYPNVFVNDADQDVSLSVWLLQNQTRIAGARSEPLINRLVSAEDFLDTTGGAYPFPPDSDLMRDVAWIFKPYVSVADKISAMSGPDMYNVIDAVGHRIGRYVLGKGEQHDLDTRYQLIHQGNGWAMVKEIGYYARTALFNAGIHAFVSVKEESPKYTYRYTIGKMSPFIDFPLIELYKELNRREKIAFRTTDRWSGSNIIGGSPREKGSKINPGQLAAIIEKFIGEWIRGYKTQNK